MAELFRAYLRTRARMTDVVLGCGPEAASSVVPACPGWTVADLLAHCTGLPASLAAGEYPTGDMQDWLDGVVEARRGRPVAEVVEEWLALDEPLRALLDGPGGLLFDDLAVHEHDLRGAVGIPDHRALEVDVVLPRTLAGLATPVREAGLGSVEVRDGHRTWRSHQTAPGWVMLTTPWEAFRAVNSRRTAEELMGIPHEGDVEPYLAILDAHLPLPVASLHEP